MPEVAAQRPGATEGGGGGGKRSLIGSGGTREKSPTPETRTTLSAGKCLRMGDHHRLGFHRRKAAS